MALPAGRFYTPRSALSEQARQFFEAGESVRRRLAELRGRCVAAVDPEGLEAAGVRAADVPAVGGDEANAFGRQAQLFGGVAIDARVRLVDAQGVDAEDGAEGGAQPGLADHGLQHRGRAVGEDGAGAPGQGGEGGRGVRKRGELPVGGDEGGALLGRERLGVAGAGMGEGVGGDRFKVRVAAHQAAQPGVFELRAAPQRADGGAVSGPTGFAPGGERLHVEEGAVGVEDQRVEAWAEGRRRHRRDLSLCGWPA